MKNLTIFVSFLFAIPSLLMAPPLDTRIQKRNAAGTAYTFDLLPDPNADRYLMWDDSASESVWSTVPTVAPEGTSVLSTGEVGAVKFLRENGDGTSSWQVPPGGGDMVLASAQTNSGTKTFLDTTFKLRNVANTFDGYFVNTNTADRIYTLPNAASVFPIATQTITWAGPSGARTYTLPNANTTLVGTTDSQVLTNKTLTQPLFTQTVGVVAGTDAQGQGALTEDVNYVATTAANPSGITLPNGVAGRFVSVYNGGTNPINIYPFSGDSIGTLAANQPITINVGDSIAFRKENSAVWQVFGYKSFGLTTQMAVGGGADILPVWTTVTGTGSPVLATAPTLTLPNATGLPLATGVTGVLPLANGGTGAATLAAADIAQLTELASTANLKGASLIGIEDVAADYTATTVEGALAEVKVLADAAGAPEGTAVLSTGEVGGTKFLREDGAGGASWQAVPAGSFDSTTVDAATWSDGLNASNIWTFDVSGTDHTMTAGNGLMTFSNNVTILGTLTASIPVGNITGVLPVPNGGTGRATLLSWQLLSGGASDTANINPIGLGALGQMLVQNGAASPTWSTSPQITNVEVGHSTDTTLSRSAAGIVSVEGKNLAKVTIGTAAPTGFPGMAGEIYAHYSPGDANTGAVYFGAHNAVGWQRVVAMALPANLGAGTALGTRKSYYHAAMTTRTLTISGTPTDGDIIFLEFICPADVVLTWPANVYRAGTSGTVTTTTHPIGNHQIKLTYSNALWKLEDSGVKNLSVPDDAYAAGWDSSTLVPTKNAIYDKIESLVSGGLIANDLAGGATLTIGNWEFDTLAANRVMADFDVGGTAANGDQLKFTFDVTGASRTIDFHTNMAGRVFRDGETAALSDAVNFPVSVARTISLVKLDGRWVLTDTGTDVENQNLIFSSPDGSAGEPMFRAMVANDIPNALIDSQHYATGSIDTAHIANAAVDSAQIATGAIDLAHLANGTDGELITWDASGAPAVVATGTATHVLTSNGAGTAPTFQAPAGSSGLTKVIKPADESVISSTTLQDDDHLTLAVAANTRYAITLSLSASNSGGLEDIKFQWSVPAGATAEAGSQVTSYSVFTEAASQSMTTLNAATKIFQSTGYIKTAGTAGNLTLQWAQAVSGATNTTVEEGSWLTLVAE